MKDLIDRIFTLGLGIAAVSKEQADKIIDELVEKGNMAKTEASDIIEELMKKGKEAQEKWETTVEERINQAVQESKLVFRQEFEELKKRVEALEEKLLNKDNE